MTLVVAQAAFRHSPSRATALAYMDAAIFAWEQAATDESASQVLMGMCEEIRDWLMNERHWRDPALHPEGIESQ